MPINHTLEVYLSIRINDKANAKKKSEADALRQELACVKAQLDAANADRKRLGVGNAYDRTKNPGK